MPGHKRNEKFGIIGSEIDITEINGFDNLHNTNGILLDIENELAEIYSAKKSFMLVNGSTVGILSAIFTVCDDGDTIIIARNCHKSVYNACMIRHLKIFYIEPEFDYENGYYTRIKQSEVDKAIKQNPHAKAVVITSPTYEGNISNVSCKIPLIIDAAHGAHLVLDGFPAYPSGDIVISSLHKTLPALTQTAVANIYNENFISSFKFYVDIFETSSPSYVLMNSVAICCDYIKNHREDAYKYYEQVSKFQHLDLNILQIKSVDDVSKIVVSTEKSTITGVILAQILRDNFDIEVEMSSANYIILMTSVGDNFEALNKLRIALTTIDDYICKCKKVQQMLKPTCPKDLQQITISYNVEVTDFENSIGKVSNEFVWAYPPDIPIISPNETISKEIIDYIKRSMQNGVNIMSDNNLLPFYILTKKQS
jgi:arginine/lysine/ornithine decarboxylase